MLNLSSDERRVLRARAHSLQPVVSISQNGLSESVVREVEVNLGSHELIKIRVYNDDRQVREQFLATLCERLEAAPVQHIGKLLVIWRPRADDPAPPARPRAKRSEPRRSKRSFQSGSGA
ncbi:MAG: RNA-binding protein [Candidatus Accumulibacter regalis]|jgi:RNA-binding protein|uniref:RNA-binding protein n=1 Tax=Accumulibacter regalis TaxID=522306 RepID=A0A011PSY3_ACCRE|nr:MULTISPECIES: YhbY family RNA-binding protein [unclassified Candidatus Accumulibacter]EXI90476.1 MAG: RNA-binding protein [Candidatus Accumulibacter regalis]MQM34148.1 ribosome assembly RNA-binding protein YhbY [Candidatus Accumulibacter phosphatis]MBL8368773.1 YhbY family RNA-binding protein [Accumulibacter sp.]MBN8515694.1 YhbY family RNA-binding protein [Accumulibacter sp.]MBO3701843.1 YhbY family RNA-binding protein [Accumulibacter sp.]